MAESKKTLKIPVAKIGRFYMESSASPLGYKTIEFNQSDFDYLLENPKARGYEPPLRRGHNKKGQGIQDGETADGHLLEYVQEDDVLFGKFEAHNDQVVEEIEREEFRYASGEFIRNALSKDDPEVRIPLSVKAVGLTNTPFIPDLPKATLINCSEGTDSFFRLALAEAPEEVAADFKPEESFVPKSNAPEEQSLTDLSLDDIRKEVECAFKKALCNGHCGDYCYCAPWVQGVYHDAGYLIAQKSDCNYRYDYTKSEDGYTFGVPQKVLMQFEVIENLSDDLLPPGEKPLGRVERMFAKLVDLLTPKKPEPVAVSLSDEPAVEPAAEPVEEPIIEPAPAEVTEAPAADPEIPAPEGDAPTQEENPDMPLSPEIEAKLLRLEALEAKEAEIEAERQSLSDQRFEDSITSFVDAASQFVTPAAAHKFAAIVRANRGVEAFSLSEGAEALSLSDALLEAVKEAVPTAAAEEVLAEQAGAVNLSDAHGTSNPWNDRIAALKAQAAK